MQTMFSMMVKGPPVAWARARTAVRKGAALPGKAKQQFFTAKDQARYKKVVQDEARLAMIRGRIAGHHNGRPARLHMPLILECVVYLPIPASWTKAEKAAALAGEKRPTAKPDIDNWVKLPMDALSGIVYEDDAQVVGFGNTGLWYSDMPRLELSVWPADAERYTAGPLTAAIFKEAGVVNLSNMQAVLDAVEVALEGGNHDG